MSLNNNQMLPARIRNMRQMNDVLNAEDIILAEIERIIDEMYQRASLLHEEMVNEAWLENKLGERVNADTKVLSYAEELLVKLFFDVSSLHGINIEDIKNFLNKWLPGHLVYQLIFLLRYGIRNFEFYQVNTMRMASNAIYWKNRMLDGSWLLNGNITLDGIRVNVNSHVRIGGIEISNVQETIGAQIVFTNSWIVNGAYSLDGNKKLAGVWEEEV